MPPDADVPIRDASTIILVRDPAISPSVLMGQRGKGAAFMPDKFVFPGGAVDAADAAIELAGPLNASCQARLKREGGGPEPGRFAAAAIRELWEETGHCLGQRSPWSEAPPSWSGFAGRGLRPDASALSFFFRALTPPGQPRRFDARFFLADAAALATDPDEFAPEEAELGHLQWVPLNRIREFSVPFITQLVLAELDKHLPRTDAPDALPFVRNDSLESQVIWL